MTRHAIERALFVVLAVFLLSAPWIVPLALDAFWLSVLTEILIWSLLAASVNLLFGYVGLLSFGQALYFGLGMYGVALGIAKLGLGFWPALGLGIVVSIATAVVAGSLAVRLTWHYFAIITVVFSLILYFVALTMKPLTGGDDGTSFTLPPTLKLGAWEASFASPVFQYFFVLATATVCYALFARLTRSPLGRAFIAVRDNDTRAALIGLNVYRLRLIAFVLAGFLAGVSGALFAYFGRYASASYMFYHVSGEAVVWAIVGGTGTLFGPLVGTAVFVLIREIVSSHWQHHALIVGIVAILIVIFAPRGIVGAWNDWMTRREAARAAP